MRNSFARIFAVTSLAFTLCFSSMTLADGKCEGPDELCAQVIELQQRLDTQKQKMQSDQNVIINENEQKSSEKAAKLIGIAATISIVLKILLGILKSAEIIPETNQGKAIIKASALVVGFLAFLATNLGFGMNWWQAFIVAGGGPGAILIHEFMKLLPAIKGEKTLPSDNA